MRSLDEIRSLLAAAEAERTAASLAAQRERADRRRAGRRHTTRSRERLSRVHFELARERALADPDIHPLKRIRLDAGLTQAQLARRAVVSKSHIGHVENGTRALTGMTAQRLARALGTSPTAITPEG